MTQTQTQAFIKPHPLFAISGHSYSHANSTLASTKPAAQRWKTRRSSGSLLSWCMPGATGHQHILPGEPLTGLLAMELPAAPCPSDQ